MTATSKLSFVMQGAYAWPVVGVTLWTVNLFVGAVVGNHSQFAVFGQLLLISAGLVAMYQRRVPKTSWGELIRVLQTVLLVFSAFRAVYVLGQLMRLIYHIH